MKAPTGNHNRPKAVLLGLLQALGGRVFRTDLINLMYLMDEANYRLRGETVTGLSYWLDYCGPNAVDDGIVRLLEELVDVGLITMTVHSTPHDSEAYGYEINSRSDPSDLPLSGDDWIEIQTAVHKYGDMTTVQIVKASKSTAPMQNASHQFERLKLQQDPSLVLTSEDIADDPLLREAIDAMLSDTGEGIALEELQESIGQPTSYQ